MPARAVRPVLLCFTGGEFVKGLTTGKAEEHRVPLSTSRGVSALYHIPDFLLECAVLWLARARRRGSKIKVTIPGE